MNIKVLYFSIVFWAFCFLKVDSQNKDVDLVRTKTESTDFYHFKTKGGMEQNSITSIAQDSLGQMWFSTKDGLLRYNGKEFFTYKHNSDNPSSIGNNFLNSVFVSKDGSVWATSIGLAKYNLETDDFEPIVPNVLSDIEIYAISQDSNGILWFIDRNSTLFRYDDYSKELQSYGISNRQESFCKNKVSKGHL